MPLTPLLDKVDNGDSTRKCILAAGRNAWCYYR